MSGQSMESRKRIKYGVSEQRRRKPSKCIKAAGGCTLLSGSMELTLRYTTL